MGGYIGSYEIDDLCTFYANTHTPSTGAAVDADAVPGYRVYEDETGTPILTGSMALLDDANTVGFYSEQLTLSAANGFEAGKSYCIRKTLVVGGVTGIDLDKLQMGAKVDMRRLGGSTQSAADLKDFADDGYDPATNKVQGVVLVDTTTALTNAPTAGDLTATMKTSVTTAATAATPVAASVTGAVGSVTGLTPATVHSDLTTLTTRLSSARAGYLDNLNIGGVVASQADITALNQSASRRLILATVGQYERPESGTSTYTVELRTYDGDGAAVNDDSTPTLTATGSLSGDLSAQLSAATNPATGLYRWTYTVLAAATTEQVRFDVAATLSASVFTLSAYSQVVNFVAATWTSTDASNLTAVFNKLPTKSTIAGTNNTDGDIELSDATGNYPGSVGSVVADVGITQAGADKVWGTAIRTLSAAGVQAIWDALTSALTTVGSLGKLLVDNINATLSSRASQASVDDIPTNAELATALGTADDAILTQVALVKAVTDKVDTALVLDGAVYQLTINALELGPTGSGASAALIADAVWDELLSGHTVSDSAGEALTTAGAGGGGDTPGTTTLLTRIVGTLAAGTHTAQGGDSFPVVSHGASGNAALKTLIDLVKAKTDPLPGDPADASDIATAFGVVASALAAVASQASVNDLPTNAELTAALAAADDAILLAITNLNDLDGPAVRAEVVAALVTDTYPEPGQEAPPATTNLVTKIGYGYKVYRNKKTGDGATEELWNSGGTVVDHKATTSRVGDVVTKGEVTTGP